MCHQSDRFRTRLQCCEVWDESHRTMNYAEGSVVRIQVAGGVALDKVGSSIPNACRLCAGCVVLGGVFCALSFAAARGLPQFTPLFVLGQMNLFALQVPANTQWAQLRTKHSLVPCDDPHILSFAPDSTSDSCCLFGNLCARRIGCCVTQCTSMTLRRHRQTPSCYGVYLLRCAHWLAVCRYPAPPPAACPACLCPLVGMYSPGSLRVPQVSRTT